MFISSYSLSTGFSRYVMGQLKTLGRRYYNIEVEVRLLSEGPEGGDAEAEGLPFCGPPKLRVLYIETRVHLKCSTVYNTRMCSRSILHLCTNSLQELRKRDGRPRGRHGRHRLAHRV